MLNLNSQSDPVNLKHRFLDRSRLLANRGESAHLAETVRALLAAGDTEKLREFLDQQYPSDLADVMEFLDEAQDKAVFTQLDVYEAAEVLDEVDETTRLQLLQDLKPDRIARLVQELPSDEGAPLVRGLTPETRAQVLRLMPADKVHALDQLLAFPPESAGALMSTGFVAVRDTANLGQAIQAFRANVHAEPIFYVYVVNEAGVLQGMIDLHTLLSEDPDTPVGDEMIGGGLSVPPELDREQVARIFARYDMTALPVVETASHKLIGIITADDVIDVLEAEATEDVMRMAGSDAEELEKRSPQQVAFMRLPWIMATMLIELVAGFVIHFFDQTLANVLLLASFMPIISAISGNTGLQSATIIVRGLSTGQVKLGNWKHAVLRQFTTTLILGSATGISLGVIGAIWYGKWTFGLVVAIGMFAAVNIAGVVGTVVPLMSKHLGFDPAITSGPFETAFQDVVGISIFLGLATLLLHYLK